MVIVIDKQASQVSYLSQYVTLMPDDVVEVELEGVGILRNRVTQPGKQ